MPAGMHHRLLDAVDVDLCDRGGLGDAAVFFQRQAIHIGAHQDRRAVTIFQDRDHAGAANPFGNVIAEGAQF